MIEFKEFEESWGSRSGFDITPLLDMIFILLIFFLLTASATAPVISVDLPEIEVSEAAVEQEIIVSIDYEGSLFLNGEAVSASELPGRLAVIYSGRVSSEVYIEADRGVDFGYVVEVMELCRQSGAGGISFLVEQKESADIQ